MKKLSSKDIRQQKIINLAAEGVPLQKISHDLNMDYGVVERSIKSDRGQEILRKTLGEMELSINSKLPLLLELSLEHLLDIMTTPKDKTGFHGYERKTRAAEKILQTATALTRLQTKGLANPVE